MSEREGRAGVVDWHRDKLHLSPMCFEGGAGGSVLLGLVLELYVVAKITARTELDHEDEVEEIAVEGRGIRGGSVRGSSRVF